MLPAYPPFEQTVNSFRRFLRLSKLDPNPVWVFRDDVTARHDQLNLRWPLPTGNVLDASRLYQNAVVSDVAEIRLRVECLCRGVPCCAIQVAKLLDESAGVFRGGLVMSLVRPMRQAIAVESEYGEFGVRIYDRQSRPPVGVESLFPVRRRYPA